MNHLADLLAEMELNTKGKRIGVRQQRRARRQRLRRPDALGGGRRRASRSSRRATSSTSCARSRARAELAFIIESDGLGQSRPPADAGDSWRSAATSSNVSNEASIEASRMMIAALGPTYQPQTRTLGMPPAQRVLRGGSEHLAAARAQRRRGLAPGRRARHLRRRGRRRLQLRARAHDDRRRAERRSSDALRA